MGLLQRRGCVVSTSSEAAKGGKVVEQPPALPWIPEWCYHKLCHREWRPRSGWFSREELVNKKGRM